MIIEGRNLRVVQLDECGKPISETEQEIGDHIQFGVAETHEDEDLLRRWTGLTLEVK